MVDVGDLFNEYFMRRVTEDWVVIHSFRRVAKAGLPSARKIVSAYADRIVQEALSENPDIYIGDPARRDESLSLLARSMASSHIANAEAAVDAASVVFAHSILDGAAFECCRISSLIAPMDWESEVEERQVKLGGVKGAEYEKLVHDMVEKFIGSLGRESLLRKIDLLFARCQPPSGWSPMTGYAFSRERIERFDALRHDVIHGAGPSVIAGLDEGLDYLNRTTMFFLVLLNYRYQLRLDPLYVTRRPPTNRQR